MRFALHDLSSIQFEELIVSLCHELLGAGVQGFATGPDGGRDAKFIGTAELLPSKSEPFKGITIIQAKHTSDPAAKFSDSDFSSDSKASVISKEVIKLKRLAEGSQIDNYVLFSNRRLGANANEKISGRITGEAGVSSTLLFGIESLERHIKKFRNLPEFLRAFEYSLPLRASPDELAEVILSISDTHGGLRSLPTPPAMPIKRIAFDRKNSFNGLSSDYAQHIVKNYLKDFNVVRDFLADPVNDEILAKYQDAVDEFSAKLIVHRGDFSDYDKLLEYLLSRLIERDVDLRRNKRLTRVVFYYMYWACDIGEIPEGSNNATSD